MRDITWFFLPGNIKPRLLQAGRTSFSFFFTFLPERSPLFYHYRLLQHKKVVARIKHGISLRSGLTIRGAEEPITYTCSISFGNSRADQADCSSASPAGLQPGGFKKTFQWSGCPLQYHWNPELPLLVECSSYAELSFSATLDVLSPGAGSWTLSHWCRDFHAQ